MMTKRVLACAGLASFVAAIAGAELLLSGTESQVNVTTTGSQVGARGRAVSGARDQMVVVWQSDDGDGNGVFARRIVDGVPGAEFPVNSVTAGAQGQAAVAAAEGLGFVVAWASAGSDGDGYGVVARIYDETGAPLGTEFSVNTFATANQEAPSVSMDEIGRFVVAWQSFLQDGDQDAIVARAFELDGTPLGTEFVVNTYTTSVQAQPSVGLSYSGFVVAWESAGQDGDGYGVLAQRLNNTGSPSGTEFAVNTYTTGNQRAVSVAAGRVGINFVLSWSGTGAGDPDAVSARAFDLSGLPVGDEFQANDYTTGPQSRAAVAGQSDGSFVVVWDSLQDGDGYGVIARRFRDDASPDGTEFQVNTYTTGFQGYTNSVASDRFGNYVVVWADNVQDSDGFGVFTNSLCTDDDDDGDCDVVCGLQPATGCKQAAPGKSLLSIKASLVDAEKHQIKWKWAKGDLTTLDEFLDPVGGTGDYHFCIYDEGTIAIQPYLDAEIRGIL